MRAAWIIAPSAGQIRFDVSLISQSLVYDLSRLTAWSWRSQQDTLTCWLWNFLKDTKREDGRCHRPRTVCLSWRINCIAVSESSGGLHVHPIHTATHCPRYQQSMQFPHTHTRTRTHTHTACSNNCLSLLSSAANQNWSAILLRSTINYSVRIQHFSHVAWSTAKWRERSKMKEKEDWKLSHLFKELFQMYLKLFLFIQCMSHMFWFTYFAYYRCWIMTISLHLQHKCNTQLCIH